MKLLSSPSLVTVIIVSVMCIETTIAKRFDKDNPINILAEIQEAGIDLGVPIEINKELVDQIDHHIVKAQGRPKPPPSKPKPKPEFGLASLPLLLPGLPESLELSSSWSLGSSLKPPFFPSFGAHRPTDSQQEEESSEVTILGSPSSQSHGRPPRPPPSSQQLETEDLVPMFSSPSESQPPPSQQTSVVYLEPNVIPAPVFSQAQPSWESQPQPMPVAYSQAPPNTVVYMETNVIPPPVYSQTNQQQQPWNNQPSQWSVQTPSISAQAPSSWYYQPPQYQPQQQSQPQQSSWTLQPSRPVSSSQHHPSYQSANPHAPFSMYQQLNLHLLESWEKIQNDKEEISGGPLPAVYPPSSSVPSPPYLATTSLNNPNMNISTFIIPNLSLIMNNTLDDDDDVGGNDDILNSIDEDMAEAETDYVHHPGYSPTPLYTNADITIDDEKFFDDDDDFTKRKQKEQKENKEMENKAEAEKSVNLEDDKKGEHEEEHGKDKDEIMEMME